MKQIKTFRLHLTVDIWQLLCTFAPKNKTITKRDYETIK